MSPETPDSPAADPPPAAGVELTKEQRQSIERLNKRLERTRNFWLTLQTESQRGSALIAAEFLNEHLFELLRQRLIQNATQQAIKDFFKRDGAPLGTFHSRIEAAYLLGLIGEKACADLHLIRKIRNKFAHGFEDIDFDDSEIGAWCTSLQHYFSTRYDNPRIKFLECVLAVADLIDSATFKATHPAAAIDWPDRVAEELIRQTAAAIDGVAELPPLKPE